jgi:predicted ATP-binding protein involved in virulence
VRIDGLTLKNFNGFEFLEIGFDPQFNLLVGDNATGKTSVLDALATALHCWVYGIGGDQSAWGIDEGHVRLVAHRFQDSFFFEKQFPCRIEARGLLVGQELCWARELNHNGGRTTTAEARNLTSAAAEAARKVRSGEEVTLPLICSYGTERLWFEQRSRKGAKEKEPANPLPSRLDGYRDCNEFEIQETALIDWIRAEFSAGEQRGKETIAFRAMRSAILGCVEGATSLYYDRRYKDVVVTMDGAGEQVFGNLSDGYRIMLTLLGDLAKRATTLNPQFGDDVLVRTPGVVLIDELDLHLHPKWQRRVIHDLKRTFPAVQFVATTHSPQLIGEAQPQEIRVITREGATAPPRSFGMDSSRVLREIQLASPRNEEVEGLLSRLAGMIDKEDLDDARKLLPEVEAKLGQDDPEITGANTLIRLLDSTR